MTTPEIVGAEKAIAGLRNDLALIAAGTTGADKLPALVLEKVERIMFDSLPRVLRQIPTTIVSGPDRDWWFNYPMIKLFAHAEMAQRRPDWTVKLLNAVAKEVPLVEANLDKLAQALREKATKTE
jgi:hypothetical protein